jgi:hypothetical protein
MPVLRSRWFAFVTCAAMLPTSTATAQSNRSNEYGGGSRLQPRAAQIVQSGPNAAAVALQKFGECIVARRLTSTEQIVMLTIDTPAYARGIDRLFTSVGDACLEGYGNLRFSESLLRGSLFEALYRRRFARAEINGFPLDFDTRYSSTYTSQPVAEPARRHIILQQFSECVTKANVVDVRKLILSSPGSSSEDASISALSPKLPACFPAGTSLEVTKPSLRSMLAEALYRMSVQFTSTGANK